MEVFFFFLLLFVVVVGMVASGAGLRKRDIKERERQRDEE